MRRVFRRRTPPETAAPYWSKAEPASAPAARDTEEWPRHDVANVSEPDAPAASSAGQQEAATPSSEGTEPEVDEIPPSGQAPPVGELDAAHAAPDAYGGTEAHGGIDASTATAASEAEAELPDAETPVTTSPADGTTTVPLAIDDATAAAELDGRSGDDTSVATAEARPEEEEEAGVATTQTQARPRHIDLGLGDDDVLGMYRQMLLARAVDERMWLLQRAGRIAFVISGQGHEGAQVAIAWPLRRGHDWMAPYYRSVASVMTFGMTAEEIIAAHLAKADDPSSGGRQMPGHYGGAAYNIISTSSPVGTQVLHATGIAMGAWIRGDDVVAITYFGEGTANQGEVHEAMNFAGVHGLPVIFVCENNGYAISVPLDKQVGGGSVAIRAEGYGFPGVTVDGTDVLECYEVAREAIDRARRGEGPTLIEARVVRLTSHSSDDDQRRYRDPAEVTALTERDPIAVFGRELREIGVLTDEIEQRMRAEIKQEVSDANRAAEQRPDPDPATAERGVYAAEATEAP